MYAFIDKRFLPLMHQIFKEIPYEFENLIVKYEDSKITTYIKEHAFTTLHKINFEFSDAILEDFYELYENSKRLNNEWQYVAFYINADGNNEVVFDFVDWEDVGFSKSTAEQFFLDKYIRTEHSLNSALFNEMMEIENKVNRNKSYIDSIFYYSNNWMKLLLSIFVAILTIKGMGEFLNYYLFYNGIYWIAIMTLGFFLIFYFIPLLGILTVLLPRRYKSRKANFFLITAAVLTFFYAQLLFIFNDPNILTDPSMPETTFMKKNISALYLFISACIQFWYLKFDAVGRKFEVSFINHVNDKKVI